MSCMFEPSTSLLCCLQLGASHFTSGESRCCAFGSLSFRAVIVSVSTSEEKKHAPVRVSLPQTPLAHFGLFRVVEKSQRQLFCTMGDIEAPNSNDAPSHHAVFMAVLPSKEFATSRKGMLLIGEVVLSFIGFVCFAASLAAAFITIPLVEFLAALFFLFAYSTKFNKRFKGFLWPLMDFLRCVTAAIIYFIISIIALSNYRDGPSRAAGFFGFVATIIFALDFYIVFMELAEFLKEGGESQEEPSQQDKYPDSDDDSD